MGSRGLRDRESRDREVWGQGDKEIESQEDREVYGVKWLKRERVKG